MNRKRTGWRIRTMLVLIMILLYSTAVCAGAVKTVKVKSKGYTRSSIAAVNAAAVVKTGQTRLRIGSLQKPSGYVVFTAKKAGRYSFRVSDLKPVSAKKESEKKQIGHVAFFRVNGDSFLTAETASVKGGKSDTLFLATKESDVANRKKTIKADAYLPARTGKIKLAKGEQIVLFFTFTKKMDLTLTVKKM